MSLSTIEPPKQLLRFLTAGSVDDGKSTLIGRLLHDGNGILDDHLAAVRAASQSMRGCALDFSLLTDGLKAEREQGITIDVAYRYFATPRRKFIIADTPGHEQYTRNMATGASTAKLAVLLLDARKGPQPQTNRHAAIAWLLGIRSFVVVVNKMDLVDYSQDAFSSVQHDFEQFLGKLDNPRCYFVPVCSLHGDNVVHRSTHTPWFDGPSVLEYLETTPITADQDLKRFRFPVQYVLRGHDGTRRYAGHVVSGMLRRGDTVEILPSRCSVKVSSIRLGEQELECAFPPLSVSLAFSEEVDVSRGDMVTDPFCPPLPAKHLLARVLWLNRKPLEIGRPYLVKHTTRQVCAKVTGLRALIDPHTLERRPAAALAMNEFGECEIQCQQPLFVDPYDQSHGTGALIILDPITNETLAAGMIDSGESADARHGALLDGTARGLTVWFTGLSSAGKTTISRALYETLWAKGYKVEWLDGDVMRERLSKGLGFSKQGRDDNVRRIGFVADLLTRNGVVVLVSAISPYRAVREEIRNRIGSLLEVFVNAPLATCEERDRKGIYSKARAGLAQQVTGVNDPYEPPLAPDVECRTDQETVAQSIAKVLDAVERRLAR
jgi:bifunctional enzyme CysN/CysC